MKPQMRFFWMIALMFFLAGCSGYQVTCFTRTEGSLEAGQNVGEICDLKPGDKVRVVLVEGEQVEGVVQIISSHEIVLDAKDNNLQPRGYTIDQVQSIVKNPSRSESTTPKSTKANLHPGDNVRLTLVDGTQVEGILQVISSHEIVLDPQDHSAQPRGYSTAQVQSIEQKSTGGASVTKAVLILGGMALIVGGTIFATEMYKLNQTFEQ